MGMILMRSRKPRLVLRIQGRLRKLLIGSGKRDSRERRWIGFGSDTSREQIASALKTFQERRKTRLSEKSSCQRIRHAQPPHFQLAGTTSPHFCSVLTQVLLPPGSH